jgi:hypothetical protein
VGVDASKSWSDKSSYRNAAAVNGPTESGMGWSKRIAELTDRAEVYGLTLASWFGVLPTRALVKPNLSYCLDCLGE